MPCWLQLTVLGSNAPVRTCLCTTRTPPGAPSGAGVSHDPMDKKEGAASVRCSFTGTPPDGPVDICEVDLGGPISLRFDELRFWIKSSVATNEGDLRIRILKGDREPTFELELPALDAGNYLPFRSEPPGGLQTSGRLLMSIALARRDRGASYSNALALIRSNLRMRCSHKETRSIPVYG